MKDYSRQGKCALCGLPYDEFGHNPQPVLPGYEQRVCEWCNDHVVIAIRLRRLLTAAGQQKEVQS